MENKEEMPIGLAFQLAMNEDAMENFTNLTESEKRQVLSEAKNAASKEQIRGIVDELGKAK